MDTLSFADLPELEQLLAAPAGVRSASTDPEKVNAPGVWIRVDGVGFDRLGPQQTTHLTLHLVVGDKSTHQRALNALASLYAAVAPVLDTLGGPAERDYSLVGLVLPGSSAKLPCLAVPFDLLTTTEG